MQLVIGSFSKVRLDLDFWMKLFEEMRCVEGRNAVYVEQLLHLEPEGRPLLSSKGILHTQFQTASVSSFSLFPRFPLRKSLPSSFCRLDWV